MRIAHGLRQQSPRCPGDETTLRATGELLGLSRSKESKQVGRFESRGDPQNNGKSQSKMDDFWIPSFLEATMLHIIYSKIVVTLRWLGKSSV